MKGWAPEVLELIRATDPNEIEQRDLWDRFPSVTKSWADGNVTLLGDSCHATMPNIGQGAGLAFEDGYELAKILEKVKNRSEVPSALDSFYKKRILRTAAVQGLGRMNSEAIKIPNTAFTYSTTGVSTSSAHSCRWCSHAVWVLLLFCPQKMDAGEARALADDMRARHKKEAEAAWAEAEGRGIQLTGVENKHENRRLR